MKNGMKSKKSLPDFFKTKVINSFNHGAEDDVTLDFIVRKSQSITFINGAVKQILSDPFYKRVSLRITKTWHNHRRMSLDEVCGCDGKDWLERCTATAKQIVIRCNEKRRKCGQVPKIKTAKDSVKRRSLRRSGLSKRLNSRSSRWCSSSRSRASKRQYESSHRIDETRSRLSPAWARSPKRSSQRSDAKTRVHSPKVVRPPTEYCERALDYWTYRLVTDLLGTSAIFKTSS